MISDLDDVLRELLIRELPVKNGEVDLTFDQPRREWSARLSRPTLNLFLHDVRENTLLRHQEWQVERNGNGSVTKRRSPVRVDLHYMITAWATEPEDEHRLLSRVLMALFRFPQLPDDLLPDSLKNQPVPIPLKVAEQEALRNAADLWGVLDNELRPAVACQITLALNPYAPVTGPLVRTRELRFGQAAELPERERLAEPAKAERLWAVGGALYGEALPKEGVRLFLVERGLSVPVDPDGRFTIGNLEAGDYTLEVQAEGRRPRRRKLTVPASDYDVKL